jgi:protein-S-isoprenylcysteine O-methyltransferase Ste14
VADASTDETSTSTRAKVGGVLRIAMMPIVFMLPAGTWRWWEAWAVSALYMGYAISIWVYLSREDPELLAERLRSDTSHADQKTWDKLLMVAMLVSGIALFVVPGLDVVRFEWSRALPVWAVILAMIVHIPGFVFIGWVMHENTFLSRVVKVDAERGHSVITTGPYAIVRHPMYSAVILLVLSFPVALGSRWGLVPAVIMVSTLVVRTALEDRTLRSELSGYPEYAAQTRYRLLPGLW